MCLFWWTCFGFVLIYVSLTSFHHWLRSQKYNQYFNYSLGGIVSRTTANRFAMSSKAEWNQTSTMSYKMLFYGRAETRIWSVMQRDAACLFCTRFAMRVTRKSRALRIFRKYWLRLENYFNVMLWYVYVQRCIRSRYTSLGTQYNRTNGYTLV